MSQLVILDLRGGSGDKGMIEMACLGSLGKGNE